MSSFMFVLPLLGCLLLYLLLLLARAGVGYGCCGHYTTEKELANAVWAPPKVPANSKRRCVVALRGDLMGIQEVEQQQPLNVKEMNNMYDGHKKYHSGEPATSNAGWP